MIDANEIESILTGALAATSGVGCLPGCAEPVDDSGLHECRVLVGTAQGEAGREVEIAVRRGFLPGYVGTASVVLTTYIYVRPPRGRRREQIRFAPTPGYRRQVAAHIALAADQARVLVPSLLAAADVAREVAA